MPAKKMEENCNFIVSKVGISFIVSFMSRSDGISYTCKETWVSTSGLEIPVNFLKACGTFEVPPPSYDELTLTAQHLSYIEFFAAAGILLSSDIKSELEKIENIERFKAVSVYMRKNFVFKLIILLRLLITKMVPI